MIDALNGVERFSLLKNTRLMLDTPLIFFTYAEKFSGMDNPKQLIDLLLNTEVFEAGAVRTEGDVILFTILIGNYVLLCRMDPRRRNITISKILTPNVRNKIEFIENKRKTVQVRNGVIFAYKNNNDFGQELSEEAKKFYPFYYGRIPNAMPDEEFTELFDYFRADTSVKDIRADYFEDRFLSAVSNYAAMEYDVEKQRCKAAFGLVYISCKSVNRAGENNQKYVYEFICPNFNSDDYPPGTEIEISLEDEKGLKAFGNIVNISDDLNSNKIITVTFKNQFDEALLLKSGGEIKKAANICQKRVRDNVVQQFKSGSVKAQYMYETFNSFTTKGFDKSISVDSVFKDMEKRGIKSNPSQREAIEKGIQTRDIALVLGPPGTGKTTVIVEWILYYIKQKKRILISSKNNKAVDNVFERVAQFKKTEEHKDLRMVRLGNADKIQANVREFMAENQHDAVQAEILSSVSETNSKIAHDLDGLNGAINLMKFIRAASEEYFKALEAMRRIYSVFADRVRDLKKTYDSLASARNEYYSHLDNMERMETYLDEAKKKNLITRIFKAIPTMRIRKKYKSGIAATDALKNSHLNCIEDYNSALKEVLSIINDRGLTEAKLNYIKESKVKDLFKNGKGTVNVNLKLHYFIESYTFNADGTIQEIDDYICKLEKLQATVTELKKTMFAWETTVRSKDNAVLSGLLINNAQVVGATCIGINSNPRFMNVDFDVAIIDEAGQIQIHDAIVPMSRANKTLMLGDHKQIPPIVDEDMKNMGISHKIDTELLEKSFFEYLYNENRLSADIKVMLDTQFRMPSEVADIISNQFYDGKYYSADFKKNLPPLCPRSFNRPLVIIDTSDSNRRFEQNDADNRHYNKYESDIIVNILKRMKENGEEVPYNEIGIISPYKRQTDELRYKIGKSFPNLSKSCIESMVATLDSFQGQERDMIIYSCTRSNRRKAIGFLKELRRLNVALSRCKKQIVIVGDFDFLTKCYDITEDEEQSTWRFDEEDDGFGFPEEDGYFASDLKKYDDSGDRDTNLTGTTRRFSEFMEYLLRAVQSGSGQYIGSKGLRM